MEVEGIFSKRGVEEGEEEVRQAEAIVRWEAGRREAGWARCGICGGAEVGEDRERVEASRVLRARGRRGRNVCRSSEGCILVEVVLAGKGEVSGGWN
jgi:hypothetical protein